ncbi:NUDIX hydrolase [Methylorubrum salsuginis]|uniref:8-oxo-dGTP pyrophosphatase MutT, NUDIX family n=1 Tax=Methylorubrum salsuginis TaxID=414703 RepID=A0A1I4FS49_9HYPH|nr:NUDIX hydrolase [Methylorubrum salsuginis]SFL20100.1 8-oxo-dGTP pyrophosphatase MutT, NUDIX family [Methylorubrum salsuginis]
MTAGPIENGRDARPQVGVLPMRRTPEGGTEVLLVTSRETRRWIIPKGWPMKGRKPFEAAAREAYEEAGILGHVGKRPIGFYLYEKRLKNRDAVLCQVTVFPLDVRKQLKKFPERGQREARWFSLSDAADAVIEAGLAGLIRAAGNRDPKKSKR